MHKNHWLSTYKPKDVDQLNEHMRKFPSCKFVTKDVTSWKARRDDGEKAPGTTGPWADPRKGPSG